jgi:hypothetical protein
MGRESQYTLHIYSPLLFHKYIINILVGKFTIQSLSPQAESGVPDHERNMQAVPTGFMQCTD